MNREQIVELLSCDICKKPSGLPAEECHTTLGRKKLLCKEYNCCRIAEKSQEQLVYVLSSIRTNTFLQACPGSGKTEVVGLKTAYEMANWDRECGGIAVLTFTNTAKDVITERVGQFLGIEKSGYPHFIGTIDSWLHGYVAHPFGSSLTGYEGNEGDCSLRVVDHSSRSSFLNAFSTRYNLNQTGKVLANQYYFDAETNKMIFSAASRSLDSSRNSMVLEQWQIDDLWNAKKSFWKAGFCTYEDVELMCLRLLSKNARLTEALARRFPLILIDECQDLSWIQLRIFDGLKRKGAVLHLIGDLNQSIYEFKRVDPTKVQEFVADNRFNVVSLSNNFRSCQQIVDLCHNIVQSNFPITGQLDRRLDHPCICVPYKKAETMALVPWFQGYLKEIGVDIDKSAIVTRNWRNVSLLRPSGNRNIDNYQKRLAMAVHLCQTDCSQAVNDSMKYLGEFFAEKYFSDTPCNSGKYFCPECVVSSIEWRQFLSHVLEECSQNELVRDLGQTWAEWVKTIKKCFGEIARQHMPILESHCKGAAPTLPDLDGSAFRVPNNLGNSPVVDSLVSCRVARPQIQITTIHSIKGQTLDAVLVVSAPTKQGTTDGHWTQWLDDRGSAASRLAYVASSRPRHLLAWAVPEPVTNAVNQLTKLGFSMLEPIR